MTLTFGLILASRLFGMAFVALLLVGVAARFRRRLPHLAFRRRQVQALAANRYGRGEIGADEYRQIRDDLKDLA